MLLAPVTALVGLGHNCGEASTYVKVSALLKGAFLLILEHVFGFIAGKAQIGCEKNVSSFGSTFLR